MSNWLNKCRLLLAVFNDIDTFLYNFSTSPNLYFQPQQCSCWKLPVIFLFLHGSNRLRRPQSTQFSTGWMGWFFSHSNKIASSARWEMPSSGSPFVRDFQ